MGNPLTATDPDAGDTLTYSLTGTDAASFAIGSGDGQISTLTTVNYDREVKAQYDVTVEVSDGNGGSDSIAVRIDLTNVSEPPLAPTALTASASTDNSVTVSATAPDNTGRPPITSYEGQYRVDGSNAAFTAAGFTSDSPNGVVLGLDPSTSYEFQLRASNADGAGPWSDSATGSTTGPPVAAGTIPDLALNLGASQDVNVAQYFSGAVDSYSAASGDADKVDVSVTGSVVSVSALAEGHATITVTATRGSDTAQQQFTVTVVDPTPITVSINADSSAITEGQDAEFTVSASRVVVDALTVSLTVAQTGADWGVSAGTASVNISAGEGTATLTRSTDDDSLDEGGVTNQGQGTISVSIDTGNYTVDTNAGSASMTINDNDLMGISVTHNAGMDNAITEGESVTFTVTGVNSVRTLSVSRSTGRNGEFNIGTCSSAAITVGHNIQGKTCTISTSDDAVDEANGYVEVSVGARPNRSSAGSARVDILDNDTAGVTVDPTTLTLTEGGGSSTYTVVLTSQPSGNVTVTPQSGDANAVSVSGALTFTAGNWNTEQTVTVGPVNDADSNGETVDVSNQVSGYTDAAGTAVTAANVRVTVNDDDSPNTPPSFNDGDSTTRAIAENVGAATDATARDVGNPLTATDADAGDTLSYSLTGTDAASFAIDDSDGQISTLTTVNYNHEADSSYSVTVEVSDGNGGTDSIAVTINVTDVDEPPLAPTNPTVTTPSGEQGSTSLSVSTTPPDNTGRPAITGYGIQYRVNGTNATFTVDSNTHGSLPATLQDLSPGTTYEVQVRAVNDEGSGAWSASANGSTTALPVITISADSASVTEGSAAEFTVNADRAPPSDLAVNLGISGGSEFGVTAGQATVTIQANQTSAAHSLATTGDDVDEPNGAVTATVQTGSGYTVGAAPGNSAEVAVNDDDTAGVTVDPTTLTLIEGGSSSSYAVTLTSQPSGNVTVTPQSDDTGAVSVSGALTFTASDWNTGQTVTVSPVADTDAMGEQVDVTNQVSGYTDAAGTAVTAASVRVTVNDHDSSNTAPSFDDGDSATRSIAENLGGGTDDSARDVGNPLTATDPDAGDTLTYSLTGTDAASFAIGSGDGQISTLTTVNYDREAKAQYDVTVEVSDGNGGSDSIAVTINLTNESEPPLKPAAPSVAPAAGDAAVNTIDITATLPTNTGRPDFVTSPIQARYRIVGTASFTESSEARGATSSLSGLQPGTTYEIQVRASNADGAGPWSDSSRATTAQSQTVDGVSVYVFSLPTGSSATVTALASDHVSRTPPTGKSFVSGPVDVSVSPALSDGEQVQVCISGAGALARYDGTAWQTLTTTARAINTVNHACADVGQTSPFAVLGNAPTFNDGASTTRSIAENVGADTDATARNVGDPLTATATDADAGDTLTYTLSGTDAGSFGFDTNTGQITTKVGNNYDREAKASYSVTVEVSDGNGGSDSIGVTINLDNVTEPPLAPTSVTATAAVDTMSLSVNATSPDNTGRPVITGYNIQYRVSGSSAAFTVDSTTHGSFPATLSGLSPATAYEVQVRAVNADGNGAWSASATGTTGTPPPKAVGTIPDLTLLVGESRDVNVAGYFSGVDTYFASSGHSSIATVAVNDSTVKVTGEAEGTATVTVTASTSADPEAEGVEQEFDVTVALPVITVERVRSSVPEGTAAEFRVRTGQALFSEVTVNVDITAEGDFGVSAGRQTATIPANGTSATISVATSSDEVEESHGSVTAMLASGDGYTVGDPSSATVEVRDDDGVNASLNTPPRITYLYFTENGLFSPITFPERSVTNTLSGTRFAVGYRVYDRDDPHWDYNKDGIHDKDGRPVEKDAGLDRKCLKWSGGLKPLDPTSYGQLGACLYIGHNTAWLVAPHVTPDQITNGQNCMEFTAIAVDKQGVRVERTESLCVTPPDPTVAVRSWYHVTEGRTAFMSGTLRYNGTPTGRYGEPYYTNGDPSGSYGGFFYEYSGRTWDYTFPVTFLWQQLEGPTVTLEGSTRGWAAFRAPQVTEDTTLKFRLTVTDPDERTASTDFYYTIHDCQSRPTWVCSGARANAGGDSSVMPGEPVKLTGSVETHPGEGAGPVRLRWEQIEGPWVGLSGANGDARFVVPRDASPGTAYGFMLTAAGKDGESDRDVVAVTVHECAGPDLTGVPGQHVTLQGACGASPDGEPQPAHAWTQLSGPTVTLHDATRADPSFTIPDDAAYGTNLEFKLTVTEEDGRSGTDTVTVTVVAPPPTACAGPDLKAAAGAEVTLRGTCSFNPFDAWHLMEHAWTQLTGPPVTLDDTTRGDPSFSISIDAAGWTTLEFQLNVTDRQGRSDADTVVVTVIPQPTACAGPDLTGAPGGEVTLQGRCSTNPDGPWHGLAHTWTQLSGPTITLNDVNRGDPSFTIPGEAADGTNLEFQLTVTDDQGQSDADTVLVTVDSTPDPTPPTACAGDDLEAQSGDTVTLQGTCSVNPHGQWWLMVHLWSQPEGQDIALSDATRGDPSFTVPSDAAPGTAYTFMLTVTDKDGESDSDDVTVTVRPAVENRAPVFSDGGSAARSIAENTAAGVNVGDSIAASDPDGDTLTYALSGNDAASFGINTETGQLLTIEGVIYDYETQASYTLTVEASDGKGGTASIAVTVSITNVNEAPAFGQGAATFSLAENTAAGVNVESALTAVDPDGDALTYTLSGTDAGSFEIGRTTGQLTTKSGVDYDYETKSSYSLTVNASDGNGGTASIAITVSLTNVDETPPEPEATPVTACFTNLSELTAAAEYAGSWSDANCKAHHQDSRARYFHFSLSEETTVSISLSAGALYISKDTPNNGWGTAPKGTYEQRKNVRRDNGKLVHDGSNSVTLTLAAGKIYTVEAAGGSGDFTLSIAPQ